MPAKASAKASYEPPLMCKKCFACDVRRMRRSFTTIKVAPPFLTPDGSVSRCRLLFLRFTADQKIFWHNGYRYVSRAERSDLQRTQPAMPIGTATLSVFTTSLANKPRPLMIHWSSRLATTANTGTVSGELFCCKLNRSIPSRRISFRLSNIE